MFLKERFIRVLEQILFMTNALIVETDRVLARGEALLGMYDTTQEAVSRGHKVRGAWLTVGDIYRAQGVDFDGPFVDRKSMDAYVRSPGDLEWIIDYARQQKNMQDEVTSNYRAFMEIPQEQPVELNPPLETVGKRSLIDTIMAEFVANAFPIISVAGMVSNFDPQVMGRTQSALMEEAVRKHTQGTPSMSKIALGGAIAAALILGATGYVALKSQVGGNNGGGGNDGNPNAKTIKVYDIQGEYCDPSKQGVDDRYYHFDITEFRDLNRNGRVDFGELYHYFAGLSPYCQSDYSGAPYPSTFKFEGQQVSNVRVAYLAINPNDKVTLVPDDPAQHGFQVLVPEIISVQH